MLKNIQNQDGLKRLVQMTDNEFKCSKDKENKAFEKNEVCHSARDAYVKVCHYDTLLLQ
jgi:hypothetical protein